jgi:hypothetical protein
MSLMQAETGVREKRREGKKAKTSAGREKESWGESWPMDEPAIVRAEGDLPRNENLWNQRDSSAETFGPH